MRTSAFCVQLDAPTCEGHGYLNNDKPWEDLPFKVAETTLGTPTWSPLFSGVQVASDGTTSNDHLHGKNSTACARRATRAARPSRQSSIFGDRTTSGEERDFVQSSCARVMVVSLLTARRSPSSAGPGEQRRFLQGFSQIACPFTTIVLSSSHCKECNAARH